MLIINCLPVEDLLDLFGSVSVEPLSPFSKIEHSVKPTSTGLNIKNNNLRRDKRVSAGGVGGQEQIQRQ